MNIPVVALIGRPNVGKSALFNRIVGDDSAIVSEEAGTTRDRHFAQTDWSGHPFWLVDTGGVADDPHTPMDVEIRRQVDEAIGEADLLLFVVDAKVGLHPSDAHVAEMLRNSGKPWMVVANKVDDPRSTDYYEFYSLGVGEVFPVSAVNGKGSGDLLDEVVKRMPETVTEAEDVLRVAVIGRPNVGKSSFVNRLLGENRLVVSEVAGTTRDAIDTPMKYHGRTFIFVDTAGLRRQSKIDDGIEFYSSLRTRRAIERADICILMVDATEGEIQNQDLKIAALAWEAGRGLIMVVNKWDLAEKDDKASAKYQKAAGEKAPFLKFVPFLFTSALTGQRVNRVLEVILEVESERGKRISTSEVNEKLGELVARLQPPQAAGREVRLNYATQVETSPPTIAVFGNAPDLVEEHYVRYLHNGFRSYWGFTGNPLRILMRPQGLMDGQALLAIVVSYLLGSIPAAYIAGKAKGVDLRKHGSGNLGATNVMRVLGTKIGLAVFLFDMAKGAVPVFFFPKWLAAAGVLSINPVIFGILCGIAAIVGHVRPIYLKFGKGGKGVATAAGVFLALAPVQTLLALLIFATVLFASGYVSLGSLTSALALPILLAATVGVRSPLFSISIAVALFVFWTHRANIARLRAGEEHRFGKKARGNR